MSKKGYQKIYTFLKEHFEKNNTFSLEELALYANYKIQSLLVYYRNKLKNKFIQKLGDNEYRVCIEFTFFNKNEFMTYISQKSKEIENTKTISFYLRANSIQAIIASIEIHNKPQISYRYQMVTILVINSWELLLKSYIAKYLPSVNIFRNDGTTKVFKTIVKFVFGNIGKDYFHIKENLLILYEYRCKYIHYYDNTLDILLFGLIQKSILNYIKFLKIFFNQKIEELYNFHILPIAFKRPISPIDFITNKSVINDLSNDSKNFINRIINSIKSLQDNGIEESIVVPFSILYKNEKRLKNADIIAAINNEKQINISIDENIIITDNPDAKKVKIKEESLINSIYTETYQDICIYCRAHFKEWKQNQDFHSHMKIFKQDKNLHYIRYLDPKNPKSTKKSFYNKLIYEELQKFYK